MAERKYLNEEKYQKTEKKLTVIAVLILVIGLCIGGFLIYRGIAKPGSAKVDELRAGLEKKKAELESKGVQYSDFAKYTDGEPYELKIITNALDPSFNHCSFEEYKNNSITKDYCKAKNSNGDMATALYIMFGIFICFTTCMIAFFIFTVAKRRHILAFAAQQTIPVAKEGIDEMAPTIGNAAGEIAKGIKKGLSDDDEEE